MKLIKKLTLICLTLMFVFVGTFSFNANHVLASGEGIKYIDSTGAEKTCTSYSSITSSTTTLTAGWWVVDSNVETSNLISCTGNVNLILIDGFGLTANKGIRVCGTGNTIEIFGQKNNTGVLTATGEIYCSGIGGGDGSECDSIIINGGTITATGGVYAGGIGGGKDVSSKIITINGGIITATGGERGAGIGGGRENTTASIITINGGTIIAEGGSGGGGAAKSFGFADENQSDPKIYVANDIIIKSSDSKPLTDSNIIAHASSSTDISGLIGQYAYSSVAEKHSVTYVANAGNDTVTNLPTDASLYISGNTVTISSTEPSRTGYVFLGWGTETNGTGTTYKTGTSDSSFTMGSEDVKLYAKWGVSLAHNNGHVWTYDGTTTNVPTNLVIHHAISFEFLQYSTEHGFVSYILSNYPTDIFVNFFDEPEGTPYNLEFAKSYGLTLENSGADIRLTEGVYPVTYNINGGTGSLVTLGGNHKAGESITLPAGTGLTKTGYKFVGWSSSSTSTTGSTGSYTIQSTDVKDGEITYYAIWEEKTTISLDTETVQRFVYTGSSITPVLKDTDGETITLSGFSYTYEMYYYSDLGSCSDTKEPGLYKARITRAEDANYKAVDTYIEFVVTYSLTYKANTGVGDDVIDIADDDSIHKDYFGAYCDEEPDSYYFDKQAIIKANTFTLENYTFAFWNTKADGTGVTYKANDLVTLKANTILYACYSVNISAQPTKDNDYTASTSTSDTVTYSWEKSVDVIEAIDLSKLTVGPGSINTTNNTIEATLDKGSYAISFLCTDIAKHVMFNTDATLKNGVTGKNNTYIYAPILGGKVRFYYISSDSPFTISNVNFISSQYQSISGENTNSIVNATENTSYRCAIKSKFNAITYSDAISTKTISFNGGDDAAGSVAPIYQLEGRTITMPSNGFTKIGYIFLGWNTDKDATTALTFTNNQKTIGNENLTYYAIWEEILYEDDVEITINTFEYNTNKANIGISVSDSDLKIDSYEIWHTDDGNNYDVVSTISGTGVYIINIIIKGKTTDFYFINEGEGSVYYKGSIDLYGAASDYNYMSSAIGVTTCDITKRDGIEFFGNISGVESENIVLGVTITISGYTVTYDANAGTDTVSNMPEDTTFYLDKTPVTISTSTPTRDGYEFIGWNTDASATTAQTFTNGKYPMEYALTIYAIWKDLSFGENISFSINQDIKYNVEKQNITVTTTNSNVKIDSFELYNSSYSPKTKVDSLGTYYIGVTLSFVEDGYFNMVVGMMGKEYSGILSTNKGQIWEVYGCSSIDLTNYTYTEGENNYDNEKLLVVIRFFGSSVTYEDNVEEEEITVPTDENRYLEGFPVTLSSTIPTRNGYTFTGWNTKADGAGISYNASSSYTMGEEDITLYATWKSLAYSDNITLTITTLEYGVKKSNITVTVNDSNLKVSAFELYCNGEIVDTITKPGVYTMYVIVEGKDNAYYFVNVEDSFMNYYSGSVDVSGNTLYFNPGTMTFPYSCGVKSCDITKTIDFFGTESITAYENVTLGSRLYFNLTGYSITYDDNVEDSSVSNMPTDENTYLKGSYATIPSTTPTRNGYKFIGWNNESNAISAQEFDNNKYQIGSDDATLYAIWKEIHVCDSVEYLALKNNELSSAILEGNYFLVEDIIISSGKGTEMGKTINICLNGHSITFTNDGFIQVTEGTTLNIKDCSDNPGIITSSDDYNSDTMLYVFKNCNITLNEIRIDALKSDFIHYGGTTSTGSTITFNKCSINVGGSLVKEYALNWTINVNGKDNKESGEYDIQRLALHDGPSEKYIFKVSNSTLNLNNVYIYNAVSERVIDGDDSSIYIGATSVIENNTLHKAIEAECCEIYVRGSIVVSSNYVAKEAELEKNLFNKSLIYAEGCTNVHLYSTTVLRPYAGTVAIYSEPVVGDEEYCFIYVEEALTNESPYMVYCGNDGPSDSYLVESPYIYGFYTNNQDKDVRDYFEIIYTVDDSIPFFFESDKENDVVYNKKVAFTTQPDSTTRTATANNSDVTYGWYNATANINKIITPSELDDYPEGIVIDGNYFIYSDGFEATFKNTMPVFRKIGFYLVKGSYTIENIKNSGIAHYDMSTMSISPIRAKVYMIIDGKEEFLITDEYMLDTTQGTYSNGYWTSEIFYEVVENSGLYSYNFDLYFDTENENSPYYGLDEFSLRYEFTEDQPWYVFGKEVAQFMQTELLDPGFFSGAKFYVAYDSLDIGTKIESENTSTLLDPKAGQYVCGITLDNLTVYSDAITIEYINISILEDAQTYTYNSQSQNFELKGSDKDLGNYTIKYAEHKDSHSDDDWSTTTPTDANSYDVLIERSIDDYYAAFNKEIKNGLIVEQLEVFEPTVYGNYTYTGYSQIATINGVEDYMSESGVKVATNAGTYTLTYTLDSNHKWSAMSDGIVTWEIEKAQAVITLDTYSINMTYGDTIILPNASTTFGEVTCDKTLEDFINAGTYIINYSVEETQNYLGASNSATVTINKSKVSEPRIRGTYIYNGEMQTLVLDGKESYMTTYESLTQKEVGSYIITFRLDSNHEWVEGSDGMIVWEIKAPSITPNDETRNQVVVESNNGLSPNVIVEVVITVETEVKSEIESNNITDYYNLENEAKLASNERIGVVFDVKLYKVINGVKTQMQVSEIAEGATIIVKMLIPENINLYKVTRILHVHSSTDIESIEFDPTKVDENGYYEITVDRLSEFAFVYENSFPVWLIVLLSLLFLLIVLYIVMYFVWKNELEKAIKENTLDERQLKSLDILYTWLYKLTGNKIE